MTTPLRLLASLALGVWALGLAPQPAVADDDGLPPPPVRRPDRTPRAQPIPGQDLRGNPLPDPLAVEAHINLRGPQQRVRVYRRGRAPLEFVTSAGPVTRELIRREPYPVLMKREPGLKVGKYGLQYYAMFHKREIGFHSNVYYPRWSRSKPEYLTVNGQPLSHGCARLEHKDAQAVFAALQVGSHVYVYDRAQWRQPSWAGRLAPNPAARTDDEPVRPRSRGLRDWLERTFGGG